MPEPDYRKILVAYITHVGEREGIDFLLYEPAGLTFLELAALYDASAEGMDESFAAMRRREAQSYRDKAAARAEALSDLAAMNGETM